MNGRRLIALASFGALAMVMGCAPKEQPPAKAPAVAEKAPAPAAACPACQAAQAVNAAAASAAKAVKETAKPAAAPAGGKDLKTKLTAVMAAVQTKDLAKIKAVAAEAKAAMCKHKPAKAEMAAKEDFKKMKADAMAAIQKMLDAKTADEAIAAAPSVKAACGACHKVYKR